MGQLQGLAEAKAEFGAGLGEKVGDEGAFWAPSPGVQHARAAQASQGAGALASTERRAVATTIAHVGAV